jgi:hypothetical protein
VGFPCGGSTPRLFDGTFAEAAVEIEPVVTGFTRIDFAGAREEETVAVSTGSTAFSIGSL